MLRDYLSGLVVLVATSSVSAADLAVTLRGDGFIRGDMVTVGDVFDNAGPYASRKLAPAPDVGTTLTLERTDLERIAEAFRMDWLDKTAEASIRLQRDAFAVDHTMIAEALAQSDLTTRIKSDAKFTITSPEKPIVMNGRSVPEMGISDAAFDPMTERFTATLTLSREGQVEKQVALTGIATEMVTVPVLANPMSANSIVSKADIVDTQIPKKTVRAGMILRADDLVGMTLKRTVKADQPLSTADVTPPLMVKRNEIITVIYRNGPIVLSAKARALSNAVRGDTVMLINVNSKKQFEATITGPQQAEVQLNGLNG